VRMASGPWVSTRSTKGRRSRPPGRKRRSPAARARMRTTPTRVPRTFGPDAVRRRRRGDLQGAVPDHAFTPDTTDPRARSGV
jgi:hypothetical protein